ncbi:uncharacterized protein A1O5_06205 [Cladophialophora psammophila CBS 110553]|uniref:Zn(2)-C6 fungal-type domain-containing protein n=1 Tax=Cladophialophora psammophila CBS 110553 TaxID=1182543 RepID=W9X2P5_9EURO|nr:uncharacterized protein A1O5_06205 [Cladophialophora psammophila CBS 110553]EXJ71211.1 hypothetical protein A1O5_06205 [Cladophialophora psammophila CBS 110553]
MSSPDAEFERQQVAGTNKRKANKAQPETAVKRRAVRACLSCRSRKVRCDVTSAGAPCTNCRLDNVTCLLTESNRSRVRTSADTVELTMRMNEAAADFPVALTFEGSRGVPRAGQPPPPVENRIISCRSSIASPVATTTDPSPPSVEQQAQGLPSYIRPLSAHLKPEDIEYLTKKGALTVPDDQLQCELLRKYIQYVHGFMPILELSAFISPIARRDGSAPVSLLLLQAVMFVSVAFVDLEYLMARGYESRRSARKIFFERVRLLYDLDCETDRTALLQALLLMTYWYERPEDEKETWYWTGVALSQAQVLGIHRNPDYLDVSPAVKRLRKRIWWSCFIRDRLLALGIRRPARIRSDDFNVPMLTLDDFEMAPFNDDLLRYLGPLPMADDVPATRIMSIACIELAQLCVHIGNILFTQYSVLGNPTCGSEENMAMMVMPRKSAEQMNEMAKCDLNLRGWLQSLDPACRYKIGHPPVGKEQENQQNASRRILRVHLALLYMIYLTATAVLHRPRALRPISNSVENRVDMLLSSDKVTDAAVGITEIMYDLYYANQLRYASTSTIPALVSATLIHLIDIRSCGEEARYTSIGRFYQCWQALQYLREMYASADHAVWFLEAVIQKANVHIPMLNVAPLPANARPLLKPGGHRFPTRFTSASVDPPGVESAGPPVMSANKHTTSLNFGNTPTDTTNTDISGSTVCNPRQGFAMALPSSTGGCFLDPDMEDTINVDSHDGTWTEFDVEDDLLQALVQFDADPKFFTTTSTGL